MLQHPTLVVDDDRLVRESLCEVLDDLGCAATAAPGGMQAIRLLKEHSYDLMVSDVDMPDISGFELLRRLDAQHRRPASVILMSARAEPELMQAAKAAGAATLMSKPVAMGEFTHLVRVLLNF